MSSMSTLAGRDIRRLGAGLAAAPHFSIRARFSSRIENGRQMMGAPHLGGSGVQPGAALFFDSNNGKRDV
jgi:hypothetical protein